MSEVKIVDIALDSGDATTNTYTVQVEGQEYQVEEWCTHNSSGIEVYQDGAWTSDYPQALEDWLDSDDGRFSDPKAQEFFRRYNDEVEPVIARIKREVFG